MSAPNTSDDLDSTALYQLYAERISAMNKQLDEFNAINGQMFDAILKRQNDFKAAYAAHIIKVDALSSALNSAYHLERIDALSKSYDGLDVICRRFIEDCDNAIQAAQQKSERR